MTHGPAPLWMAARGRAARGGASSPGALRRGGGDVRSRCGAVFVVLSLISCGGDAPTAPTPTAALNLLGSVSVVGCFSTSATDLFTCMTFTGSVENVGVGCATQVRGITVTSLSRNGQQLGSADWSYASVIHPGERIAFAGGPITI